MLEWALANNVPCVLMSETNKHDSNGVWWKDAVKRRFVALCNAALVGGAWHREYLIELGMGPESIFCGYDVVDNRHFAAGSEGVRGEPQKHRSELRLPEEYFLACARFEPKKNFRRIIEAYASYARDLSSVAWRLVIAGDGPSRSELNGLTQSIGVADRVVFVGLRTYEELPQIYGLARVFLHASTTEQWGLVVNEAMAAGLPVLVSGRCGCAPDLVQNGRNGYTFDPYDTDELARLMSRISSMTDAKRSAMGQASREIISRWTPETFADGLTKAVEVALNTPRPKATLYDTALIRALFHRPRGTE
jgi:glycosyltransferase involved in cell wall biosynthesis